MLSQEWWSLATGSCTRGPSRQVVSDGSTLKTQNFTVLSLWEVILGFLKQSCAVKSYLSLRKKKTTINLCNYRHFRALRFS